MKTKIVVFNDRTVPMHLQVQDTGNNQGYGIIKVIVPSSFSTIEIEIPDGHIPFLKIWESGQALLTHMEAP